MKLNFVQFFFILLVVSAIIAIVIYRIRFDRKSKKESSRYDIDTVVKRAKTLYYTMKSPVSFMRTRVSAANDLLKLVDEQCQFTTRLRESKTKFREFECQYYNDWIKRGKKETFFFWRDTKSEEIASESFAFLAISAISFLHRNSNNDEIEDLYLLVAPYINSKREMYEQAAEKNFWYDMFGGVVIFLAFVFYIIFSVL